MCIWYRLCYPSQDMRVQLLAQTFAYDCVGGTHTFHKRIAAKFEQSWLFSWQQALLKFVFVAVIITATSAPYYLKIWAKPFQTRASWQLPETLVRKKKVNKPIPHCWGSWSTEPTLLNCSSTTKRANLVRTCKIRALNCSQIYIWDFLASYLQK